MCVIRSLRTRGPAAWLALGFSGKPDSVPDSTNLISPNALLFSGLLFSAVFSSPLAAQEADGEGPDAAQAETGQMPGGDPQAAPPSQDVTAERVEAWAEEYFNNALANQQVSGAVVSFVKDGELAFSRGYGLADVVTQEAADPVTTRVRIGSTTKTFTATIIAQLMEEGLIASVDEPANRYLRRIELPDNDGVEITLKHLLTHTAGFADRFFQIGSDTPVIIPANPAMIEALRPEYARPAGERVVYSNYGVATLGWIIEDVTGRSMAQEMQRRIFGRLGMDATVLPVDLAEPEGLGKPGLITAEGVQGPVPFTAINPAIAQTGAIVSTAQDMAAYMNAQLGQGTGAFSPAVRRNLQTPLAANADGQLQVGMVYFLDNWAGQRVAGHGGNWPGFHTWMILLPEQNAGFFVSLMSDPAPESLPTRFLRAVAPQWAGPPSPALVTASGTRDQFLAAMLGPKRPMPAVRHAPNRALSGIYVGDRRPFTSVEALSSLVYFGGAVLDISINDAGLSLGAAGPFVADGRGGYILDAPTRPRLAAMTVPSSRQPVFAPDLAIYTFTRVPAWNDPRVHSVAIHVLILLSLLGLFAVVWYPGKGPTWPRKAAFVLGLAGAVLAGCATVGLERGESLISSYFAGHITRLVVFVVAAHVLAIASLATAWAALAGRVKGGARLHASFLALVGLGAAVILWHYNAIGIPRF